MKIRTLFLAAILVAAAVCPYAAVPGKWYAVTVGGKGIIVPDGSMEDETPVEIWTQTDVPSQLWQCLKGKGRTMVLQSDWRGNCLCRTEAARAGAPVVARAVCGSMCGFTARRSATGTFSGGWRRMHGLLVRMPIPGE